MVLENLELKRAAGDSSDGRDIARVEPTGMLRGYTDQKAMCSGHIEMYSSAHEGA